MRTHFVGDLLTLLWRDWSEALGLEKFDAAPFVAEIGFETAEDYGCCWTKVQDFGIPLRKSQSGVHLCFIRRVVQPCQSRFLESLGNRSRSRRRGGQFLGS